MADFNFGAVKLALNLPNISLFLILSLARKPVRGNPLLSISLLKLTEPFWISHVSSVSFFFFCIGHLLQTVSGQVDFMTGVFLVRFAL